MEYSLDPVDINVRKKKLIIIFVVKQKYGIHTYNYLLKQAKRDKLNIKKLNPPGIFKKRKGNREFGEKFESKFYPDNYKNDVLYMNYDDLLDNLYMENKGIDFGLRCYKNYNNKHAKKDKNNLKIEQQIEKIQDKTDVNELIKKYVNNQFTFKQNYGNTFENNLEQKDEINANNQVNLVSDNYNNDNIMNQNNLLENKYFENNFYKDKDEQNQIINNKYEFEDIRLNYVMEKLGLESLIPVFEQYHMSFNDILFLTKDDLNELGLKIFQKNRLISFVEEYSSKAKNYTLEEIEKFFDENRMYNINNYQ